MLGRVINQLEEGFISLLLVTTTLLVFVEVVLRFGFSIGFLWFEELTLHLSAWMVLFGASYGVKVGSHIGVDAFVRLLTPATRRLVSLAALAVCLAYCLLFCYGAWGYLSKMQQIGIDLEDLPIPKYIAHSILLFGFILLGIRFIQLAILVYKGERDGFEHADEARDALKLLEEERRASEAAGGKA